MERAGGSKGGRARPATWAALCFLTALSASGGDREYKPVRAPVVPGVRAIAEGTQRKQLAPYLDVAGGDILFASDLSSEVGRGGTNSAAALGNGGMSVLISPWSDLTVLRWPSPIYSDQLRYYTLAGTKDRPVRMDQDAPSPDWRRYGHPRDACPGLGSRGGVQLDSKTVWIGDPSWTTLRGFVPEDAMVLVTRLKRPEASVEVTDFVDAEQDLLVRSFKISGTARQFFYHATFAPQVPNPVQKSEWDPAGAGFGAVYLASDQVIVHFQPRMKKGGKPKILTGASSGAAALDALYPEGGAFVAWGFAGPANGYQVGADTCGKKIAAGAPEGGWSDAEDGRLSGNAWFTGPVNAALSSPLSGSENTVTVVIAAAETAEKAAGLVKAARAAGMEKLRDRTIASWQKTAARAHLPATDPVTTRVIRRSVLNVVAGQDRESGAIVASISRQPPYHFDYPRDSAFFDLLLDLAGFPEKVSKHHQLFVRTQYQKRLAFAPIWIVNYRSPWFDPSGNWPQKMSVDGSSPTSFLILPCEIDETALTVWNFWRHERVLPEADRALYRAEVRAAFIRSADNLLGWVDLKKGWTKPAIEDDSFPPDATLHGASSTLTALAAACAAGPGWDLPPEQVKKYCAAARSLRAGIRARTEYKETLDQAGFRGLAWTLWPTPAFDDFNEPGARAIKERIAKNIEEKVNKKRLGFAYLGEDVFTLALADRKEGKYRDLLERALILLTHEVAFPGTDCYGEITMWGDYAGTGQIVAQQRTAIPHLWNGATVYLSALALYEPERFDLMRPAAP